jgi:hypothetical protein
MCNDYPCIFAPVSFINKTGPIDGMYVVLMFLLTFQVTAYDTLPKIALKFDVTPSQLSHLNKLAIRTLYPGQVIMSFHINLF